MKFVLFTFYLALVSVTLFAQKNSADEHFKFYRYDMAIPLYEKYIEQNSEDYASLKNLAICYQLTNNTQKAAETYMKLVNLNSSTKEDLYQLIQMLRTEQSIETARPYVNRYKELSPGMRADNLLKSLDLYPVFMQTADEFKIVNMTVTHKSSVFGTAIHRNKIVVTAENNKSNKSNWTGRGYTDVYVTDKDFKELTPFAKEVMIKLDDGTPVFTDNGNTMYYTTVHDEFTVSGNINTQKLKIGVAKFDGTKWTKHDDFPFNSVNYKTAHPAISPDGKILVFDSDMEGGKGGMDLYMCIKEGSMWSRPVNLSDLNTVDNELFPVFTEGNDLIFSSNGLPGLGGLDLFLTKWNTSGFSNPANLNAPLNSSYDDFLLFTDNNFQSGYLSSNRGGESQIDDIFYFEKKSAVVNNKKNNKLIVNVLDKYTRTPLPYAKVIIKDANGQVFHQGLTDPEGKIELEDLPPQEYKIQGMLNDVSTTIATVDKNAFSNENVIIREVLHNDPRFTLAGIAINSRTGQPLEGVLITCTNITSGISKKMTTTEDGKFFFQLEQNSNFEVQGQKKGWLSSELAEKTTMGLDRSQQLYVNIELNIHQPVAKGTIALKKIHYSYDKCDIRPDAAVELNRLVKLMNDYTDMIIELSSHTDARGSDSYNLKLSQCRAESAVNYLIQQGISKDRLNAKGYGETKLVNNCLNGIECSDLEHEQNRRTEFTILNCTSCPQ